MRPAIARALTTALTSRTRRDLVRGAQALHRRLRGMPPTVHYFHVADDPFSHVAAQALTALAARYRVVIKPWMAPPPDDSAAPDRERLRRYALRDAPRLAAAYGYAFPAGAEPPAPDDVSLAQRALLAAMSSGASAERAPRIGSALWSGDRATLTEFAQGVTQEAAQATTASGGAERRRLGHYLGAMFHFEGEWYWGLDRLHHLEARLSEMGLDSTPGEAPITPFHDMALPPGSATLPVPAIEFWFSFRSPYSWLAFPRARRLARHYGAEFRPRFILPMVMRGLPVPANKRIYIVLDAKREAERLGLPFGTIVDPVGAGAERALAVMHHAMPLGLGEDFAELALKAAFADGIALASDRGLMDVAARAGLSGEQVRAALADESWRDVAEANRAALFDAGLWGAPTFRIEGRAAHWGQDRLWALEQDIGTACGWASAEIPIGG